MADETPQVDPRIQSICLMILTAIGIAAALYWLRSVMVPFVLAVFLAYAIKPLVELQVHRLRLPGPLAVVSTLLIALAVLVVIGSGVSASIYQLAENAEQYTSALESLIETANDRLPLARFGIEERLDLTGVADRSVGMLRRLLVGTAGLVRDTVSQGLLVLFFLLFLLLGAASRTEPIGGVWGEAEGSIRRYVLTKLAASAATGVLVGTLLSILGVDMAIAFGCFALLLNFIPSIGSIVATLLPLPVVVVSPELSMAAKVLAFALPGAVQITIGNVIEPRVMGKSLDLHPVTILLALIFWGALWGIAGMFLATPITALVKIVLQRLPYTAKVADLLAGRIDTSG